MENCGKGDVGGSGGQKFYKFLDEDAYEELFETQMETIWYSILLAILCKF